MTYESLFNVDVTTRADKSIRNTHVHVIGFFLCSFDHIYGINVLYSYPPKLKEDSNELSILKTHCIWKLDRIPLRIDLKFSEFVYSAFQLQDENRENDEPKEENVSPLYVAIIKFWKAGKQVTMDKIKNFKDKLIKTTLTDLDILYKRKILECTPIKRMEYKELSKKSLEIEKKIDNLWLAFQNQLELTEYWIEEKTQPIISHPSSAQEKGECNKELFQEKIGMRTLRIEENPDQLLVILNNKFETLQNVLIQISKRTEFFSETHWEEQLDEWPYKEEMFLEFTRSDEPQKYLIKISSDGKTIVIKSIEIDPITQQIEVIDLSGT